MAHTVRIKACLPNGEERSFELDASTTSQAARDHILSEDPTIGQTQWRQYRLKIVDTGDVIKAGSERLSQCLSPKLLNQQSEITVCFLKRVSTMDALRASTMRDRPRMMTSATETSPPPRERKVSLFKKRHPTLLGGSTASPTSPASSLHQSSVQLGSHNNNASTNNINPTTIGNGGSQTRSPGEDRRDTLVKSSSALVMGSAAAAPRPPLRSRPTEHSWGSAKRRSNGCSNIMLGAQKWQAAAPAVPAEKQGHSFLRDSSASRMAPPTGTASSGTSGGERVRSGGVPRELLAAAVAQVLEEDKTGSGSEPLDSEDDASVKSQCLSESKESDEEATSSAAAESEIIDFSERESGTETTDRSEAGSDSDVEDLFNYDYENEDMAESAEEEAQPDEAEAEADGAFESDESGDGASPDLSRRPTLGAARLSKPVPRSPSAGRVARRSNSIVGRGEAGAEREKLLQTSATSLSASHAATTKTAVDRPVMRRRQTTHTQFKIKHAATLREFQLKPKTVPLRLRYDGQEVLLHISATDTAEAFIGLAVNTIKGAVMSATALELVMENEQVLNPTDVLAKHPYIAEAVENKGLGGGVRRTGSIADLLFARRKDPGTAEKKWDYELRVIMPDGSTRMVQCMYRDTPKNLKEALQDPDKPLLHLKNVGFRLPDGNKDGICLSDDLALAKLAQISQCLFSNEVPTVLFVERDREAVKQDDMRRLEIGSLVGKPLCWAQEQDEVTVFRESACRQRYLERQERLRSIEAGGVPIQRSEVEGPVQLPPIFIAPPLFADPAGVKKGFAVKGDMTATELLEEAHRKMISRKLPDTSAQDFILQVAGTKDYIDGPYPVHSFKYLRQCLTTNERPNMEMIERKCVAMEKPLPAEDPMDAEELTPPSDTTTRNAQLLSMESRPWHELSCFSLWDMNRAFRVRIVGVEKINPNTTSFQKASGKTDITEANLGLFVTVGCYHGGALISPLVRTNVQQCSRNPRWFEWVNFEIPTCNIPHAARLCFTLWAARTSPLKEIPLGWVACQLFDYKNELKTGLMTLNLWHNEEANPIGTCGSNTSTEMPLFVEFDQYALPVVFPTEPLFTDCVPPSYFASASASASASSSGGMASPARGKPGEVSPRSPRWSSPAKGSPATKKRQVEDALVPESTPAKIDRVLSQDPLYLLKPDEKQLLWDHRYHLLSKPKALPKFLLSITYQDRYQVQEMHHLLAKWPHFPNPVDALELLDAKFADAAVRQYAVECLDELSNEQLGDYLLQLVLKYELYHDSALSRFLLRRALRSKELGHMLYWYLKSEVHVPTIAERYELLLEAYLRGCGSHRAELKKQEDVHKEMARIAYRIKEIKEAEKKRETLQEELKRFGERLEKTPALTPFQLPLDYKRQAKGVLTHKCKYMDSKKKPLWLVWENADATQPPIYTIFKAGDDLRQDMLTLQMLKIMDKLWKSEGLDLKLSPYGCVSTGHELGMIEVVTQSETTANISSAAAGVKGAFAVDPIANWLAAKNKGGQYRRAVENFISSCAGYCVATYVLGIGDRHNDNIMLNESGLLFHIDFGHFLGNYKKKLGIKREKAPFVLTPDFAYVMGGRDSRDFKTFCDKCCKGYNILRKHSNMFINLFCMMLSTGIPELTSPNDIQYLRTALCLSLTDEEAAEEFQKLIYESLDTKTTQWNNLAHMIVHRKK